MKIQSLAVLGVSLLAAACASSSANDGTVGATTASATAAPAEPAALSGTWGFVLASSDVAASFRAKCTQSSNNDSKQATACWDEIATQAAREKIRFGKDDAGNTVWTSFETDGKQESIYVQVPVQLASDGPGHVLAKVSGAPKGDMAAQFAKSSMTVMRIEVVDGKTIAMIDPKKGRLVYTRE